MDHQIMQTNGDDFQLFTRIDFQNIGTGEAGRSKEFWGSGVHGEERMHYVE